MLIKEPFIYDDFSSGVIDDKAVSDSLMPRNAVRKAINCVFDNPRGAVSSRLGSTRVGTDLGTTIAGIHNFRDAGAGTNHRLLVTNDSGTTSYLDGSSFTSTLIGDTAGLKTRFITYLDLVARINGTQGVRSWDGAASTWAASGGALDVGNWPSGTKYAKVFNSRVYTAGAAANPDRLYFSSIPSDSAISWGVGNGFIDINPNDGENGITSLETNGTVLLVFKYNSLYRWDGSATFANKVINIGTSSNESVALHDSGWVYFFGVGKGGVGAYRTTGGYPQKLSLNIDNWFQAVDGNAYQHVAGFCDDDHYYLSVGRVTVNSETYSNAVFVYTISAQTWHIEDRGNVFTVFSPYRDTNNELTIVGGDNNGNVHTMNSGTDDLGNSINSECEFAPVIFTTRGRTKQIGRAIAYANNFTGVQVLMKTDEHDFEMIGEMKDTEENLSGFTNKQHLFKGKRFFPKIVCSNASTGFEFNGFEFVDVEDEGHFNKE